MADLVTMVHPRLGERQVRRDQVRRMRQNKWSVKTETPETPKRKSSKENEQ